MRGIEKRAGFTLVEVLVVLLIASIVMAILGSVLAASFEILRTGESRAKMNSNARVVLEYVCDDISSAAYIPLSTDRDLNGYPDETVTSALGSPVGYGLDAVWRVAKEINNVPWVAASFYLSEAWSDRIMTTHDSSILVGGQQVINQSFTVPKILNTGGNRQVAEYTSFFRLAIPANNNMPYCIAGEWDRNGDGVVDPVNTGAGNLAVPGDGGGEILGYPELVPVGPHKETAAVIQDIFYKYRDELVPRRVRQIPIASNITRIKYEYLHEVPVYLSRIGAGGLEVAYQNMDNGAIEWLPSNSTLASSDVVPLISHWELRIIDVAYNGSNGAGGLWTDPISGAEYGTLNWRLQDQYPEGYNSAKTTGDHVAPSTGMGLGTLDSSGSDTGWNCTVFYNLSSSGLADIPDNAPIDRLAFVTTGLSGGQAVEGGLAGIRPDMEALHGASYMDYTEDPTGVGDMGDADGIPDGDGIPDDPVPGWWLPYLRAVRVTVVATPRQVIEQRQAKSGQVGKTGSLVFYRLDSPVPYADTNRTAPLYNQKQDYVGPGSDLVVTKTVPVNYSYRRELLVDPFSALLSVSGLRRVELNYFLGRNLMHGDPIGPDDPIRARTPASKLYELE
ncbi:prepilin-type N-terminal cleavage/methylation domain-containing protein [bacterium]|nr:prepilin-type N-terminal cleavage/methylation domain-containing protein [bacterium]